MKYNRFEELPVWQAGTNLCVQVFNVTALAEFRPAGDLSNQLQRAALSISNNIAEGFERGSTQELINFLYYARGSAAEVRSILAVAERLEALEDFKSQISDLKGKAENISRQLGAWLKSLKEQDISGQRDLSEKSKNIYEFNRKKQQFVQQLQAEQEIANLRREEERLQRQAKAEEGGEGT